MKVAILSESPADEAGVRILAEAMLGQEVEPVEPRSRRSGGISGVMNVLAPVLKWLHYHRSAEGLIVVVDSNCTPVHAGQLGEPCENASECRLCIIRNKIAEVQRHLTPVPSYGPIKTAVGLAVPAIEAWYLCGKDENVSENAWVMGMQQVRPPYTKHGLKNRVYRTDRYSLATETSRATEEMQRVIQDLDRFHRQFPVGAGSLLRSLEQWHDR